MMLTGGALQRFPIRGGNWNNGANAGPSALNLNNPRSNANNNIGFRPALERCQKHVAYGPRDSAPSKGRAIPGPKSRNTEQAAQASSPAKVGAAANQSRTMAVTYTNLFEQIYDFENLYRSYLKARKGKRDNAQVQLFERDLECELIQLQNELIWGTYQTGSYHTFYVHEPKTRMVAALPFRDRIVQHAVFSVIEPIWEARFIHDSYACRVGRGMHSGANRAQTFLRNVNRSHGRVYVLKADISKYFASIDHGIIKKLLRRHIACQSTLALMDNIIDSACTLPGSLAPVGLPIGNLTSQLCANIYLHELDMYVKHDLGQSYYCRYMDDFVVVHHDKTHLHEIRRRIESFLWSQLRLRTNHKTQVFPIGINNGRALDFLGYRIYPTHRRLRVDSIKCMKTKLRRFQRLYRDRRITLSQIQPVIQSWIAHASHAQTYGLRSHLLSSFPLTTATIGA
jgi:retron-type reverse transcriptase